MMQVQLRPTNQRLKILCLGAHPDDIEIGCGGTVLRLCRENADVEAYWAVFSASRVRQAEAIESAHLFLHDAKEKHVVVHDYRDAFFPHLSADIKESFESIKLSFSPDIIFTHYRSDLHQDHRFISELTWNTFRNHLILEYEIIKYDGDLGNPGFFVYLDESICRQKAEYLCACFESQASKQWFSSDVFLSLLRLRGVESNAPDRYSEAFYSRKLTF